MADDIVARLRERAACGFPIAGMAADGIERLRRDLAHLREEVEEWQDTVKERDRLRAALERISTMDFETGTHEQAVETMTDIARAALAGVAALPPDTGEIACEHGVVVVTRRHCPACEGAAAPVDDRDAATSHYSEDEARAYDHGYARGAEAPADDARTSALEFAGYLTGELPELHGVECGRLIEAWEKFQRAAVQPRSDARGTMIEYNPDEGMRLFCCRGAVHQRMRGDDYVTHESSCWYVAARAALAGSEFRVCGDEGCDKWPDCRCARPADTTPTKHQSVTGRVTAGQVAAAALRALGDADTTSGGES